MIFVVTLGILVGVDRSVGFLELILDLKLRKYLFMDLTPSYQISTKVRLACMQGRLSRLLYTGDIIFGLVKASCYFSVVDILR